MYVMWSHLCIPHHLVAAVIRSGLLRLRLSSSYHHDTTPPSRQVQAGDCIVAFSKADICSIKQEIEAKTSYVHSCGRPIRFVLVASAVVFRLYVLPPIRPAAHQTEKRRHQQLTPTYHVIHPPTNQAHKCSMVYAHQLNLHSSIYPTNQAQVLHGLRLPALGDPRRPGQDLQRARHGLRRPCCLGRDWHGAEPQHQVWPCINWASVSISVEATGSSHTRMLHRPHIHAGASSSTRS